MNIGWPQGIILGVMFLALVVNASKNGQPREGNHDLGAALVLIAIEFVCLWQGGFFA